MSSKSNPFFSIILPAYNEGENIYNNILRVCKTLSEHNFEIIVVDDGSADNTYEEAKRAEDEGYPIQAILQEENRGKGATLFHGLEFASGERIAFLDADLEIAPEYLLNLLKVMDDTGADVVAGVKDMSENQFPWLRRTMSKIYKSSVAFLFGLSISDTQTGIKLFKREVLAATVPRLSISRFAFDIELLLAASRFGYKIVEYPVKIIFSRSGGLGRMNTSNIFGAFRDTFSIYARASFWRWLEPSLGMRIWMLLFVTGIFLFGVGVGKLLTPVILQGSVKKVFYIIALQFLPTMLRDWLLLIGGFLLIIFGSIQLNKKLLEAFVRRDRGDDLAGIFRKKDQ
ncbi:MAG: glycosyltransferase family 2 protein [Chloroflexi bacterium]|nr:glycosyltransferase family 2 protein [Chloroflexota bacterium]